MEQLKDMKKTLTCKLKAYLDNGIGEADICEVKETVDAIKDLSEAIYYCTVTEAMEKGEEYPYDDRMGYTQPHYPGGTAGRNGMSGKMGYNNYDWSTRNPDIWDKMGYHDDMIYRPMIDQEPYVKDYLDWKNAKRHYTETHSTEDKDKMDIHMRKHFNNFLSNAKEMYKDADISSKQEMKQDLLAMINAL